MCLLKSLKITNFVPTLYGGPRFDCFEIMSEKNHNINYDLYDNYILDILIGLFNIYKEYGAYIFCPNSFIDKEKKYSIISYYNII